MVSSELWFGAEAGFYNGVATQSLRFDDGSSAFLSRTPSSTTNEKTFTFSCWAKRGTLGNSHSMFSFYDSSSDYGYMRFSADGTLRTSGLGGGSLVWSLISDALHRDVSAWYHVVFAFDTTQSTSSNRIKMYINGTQITSFSTNTYPSQDLNTGFNDTYEHRIGLRTTGSMQYDGYLSEVNFVDGLALDPTYFGETKNGVWIPIEYTGSYGTNGFRLQFNQTGVGTASTSTIGADTSGNTNHFTSSGIVASDCAMSDSPENNFCTWNPLTIGSQGTLSEGNLKNASFYTSDLSGNASTFFPESGKWYWEVRVGGASAYPYLGITSQEKTNASVAGGTNYAIAWRVTGNSQTLGSSLGTVTKEDIPSFTNGDIISFALDVDARKLWVAENNIYADSGNPANGTGENASWTLDVGVSPFISGYQSHGVGTVANFGQDDTFAGAISSAGNTDANGIGDFAYAPPNSFLALCTSNLPEPTISPNATTQADDHFNTLIYDGNDNATRTFDVGFVSDFSWFKARNADGIGHQLYDSSRGVQKYIASNTSGSEQTNTEGVTSFNSSGLLAIGNSNFLNKSGRTHVLWNWKANGGTTSSNSDGSITSTVQANTTSAFSIVTYTGNGTNNSDITIGHSLGVTPRMVIVKNRTDGTRWQVYHEDLSADGTYTKKNIVLNTTDGESGYSSQIKAVSSTTFTVRDADANGNANVNKNNSNYVAYCFAEIEGYSKIGSYIANGSNDGTFVHTGFEISFLMIKRAVGGTGDYSSWAMYDNVRKTINSDVGTDSNPLFANRSSQEGIRGNGSLSISGTRTAIDFLSNGFKLRDVANEIGVSGNTYIYMAFAKNPFKYSTAQ